MNLGPNGGVATIADVEQFAAEFAAEPAEENA